MNLKNYEANDRLIPIANDDTLFVMQLLGKNVRLSTFKKIVSVTLDAEGQNKIGEFKFSSYDFLLKDIHIFAYCKAGNFMPAGIARDLITVTLKNTTTDDYICESGTDIQAFSPSNVRSAITPTIIDRQTSLSAEFKHIRKVDVAHKDFPKGGTVYVDTPPAFDFGGSLAAPADQAPDPFPIFIQMVLTGAKIFPVRG